MTQKTRNELKDLFKTGAKPSGDDFKAFIDSTLNVSDDGIAKAAGADTPLKINAQGTDEKLLDFYTGETKTWSINQKPADDKSGLNIATPEGSKLFIDSSNGNVGIGTTSPDAKLEVSGDLKLQSGVAVNKFSTDGTLSGNSDLAIPTEKAVKTYVENIVVTGMIVMWSGESNAIPTGWALCDGVDGRPDLQGRFIVGAGGQYKPKNKGGEEKVKLTKENMPEHTHRVNDPGHFHRAAVRVDDQSFQRRVGSDWPLKDSSGNNFPLSIDRAYTGISLANSGFKGNELIAVENRPPFFALAFIIYVGL